MLLFKLSWSLEELKPYYIKNYIGVAPCYKLGEKRLCTIDDIFLGMSRRNVCVFKRALIVFCVDERAIIVSPHMTRHFALPLGYVS